MVKKKIIVMFSGGLDSRLVVKLLQEKKKEIIALFFKLPFSKNIDDDIKKFAKDEEFKLKIFDCTKGKLLKEFLDVVRNPKYGRGTAINPCIDCRIFILKKAKKFADDKKIKFIATGEVVGERPMSQNERAMKIIEEESGLKGRLIRPLCDLGIKGRSRKEQMALAKKFKIDYPHPAGGCLLCEKLYCEKLKKVLKRDLTYNDIKLLSIGRHFENSKIILGRNIDENKILEKEKGMKVIPKQPGPSALVDSKKNVKKAKELIQKYSRHKIKGFENVQDM